MSRIRNASPALVISIIALVAAVVVPAVAQVATKALSKRDKRVVTKISTRQANRQITRRTPGIADSRITNRAPGLSVASANTASSATIAGDADKVDGKDASDFAPADEVHSSGRVVLDDTTPGDGTPTNVVLLDVGGFTVLGQCYQNLSNTGNDEAIVNVSESSLHSSFALSTGASGAPDTGGHQVVNLESAANEVQGGHLIAVSPNGGVLSVSASGEVGDPAGDCIFGVTAVGP
jgi:hypothetical protein